MATLEALPTGEQAEVGLDEGLTVQSSLIQSVRTPLLLLSQGKWTLSSSSGCPEGCVALTSTGPLVGGSRVKNMLSLPGLHTSSWFLPNFFFLSTFVTLYSSSISHLAFMILSALCFCFVLFLSGNIDMHINTPPILFSFPFDYFTCVITSVLGLGPTPCVSV